MLTKANNSMQNVLTKPVLNQNFYFRITFWYELANTKLCLHSSLKLLCLNSKSWLMKIWPSPVEVDMFHKCEVFFRNLMYEIHSQESTAGLATFTNELYAGNVLLRNKYTCQVAKVWYNVTAYLTATFNSWPWLGSFVMINFKNDHENYDLCCILIQ